MFVVLSLFFFRPKIAINFFSIDFHLHFVHFLYGLLHFDSYILSSMEAEGKIFVEEFRHQKGQKHTSTRIITSIHSIERREKNVYFRLFSFFFFCRTAKKRTHTLYTCAFFQIPKAIRTHMILNFESNFIDSVFVTDKLLDFNEQQKHCSFFCTNTHTYSVHNMLSNKLHKLLNHR